MFKMIEVVGVSKESFSDAVNNVVAKIAETGKKAIWFEVVEQRGAISGGKVKEFQVKLKVAVALTVKSVSDKREAEEEEICPGCSKPVSDGGHLCHPLSGQDKSCEWCGMELVDERHLCGEKVDDIAYICNSCGRTAVKPEHVCDPKKIS